MSFSSPPTKVPEGQPEPHQQSPLSPSSPVAAPAVPPSPSHDTGTNMPEEVEFSNALNDGGDDDKNNNDGDDGKNNNDSDCDKNNNDSDDDENNNDDDDDENNNDDDDDDDDYDVPSSPKDTAAAAANDETNKRKQEDIEEEDQKETKTTKPAPKKRKTTAPNSATYSKAHVEAIVISAGLQPANGHTFKLEEAMQKYEFAKRNLNISSAQLLQMWLRKGYVACKKTRFYALRKRFKDGETINHLEWKGKVGRNKKEQDEAESAKNSLKKVKMQMSEAHITPIDHDDDNQEVTDDVLCKFSVFHLPHLERVVKKLDFEAFPRMSRDGSKVIKVHDKKQAGELLRTQVCYMAHRLQYKMVNLTKKARIASAVSKLLCYDHGFKEVVCSEVSVRRWIKKVDDALMDGNNVRPLLPNHKGSAGASAQPAEKEYGTA